MLGIRAKIFVPFTALFVVALVVVAVLSARAAAQVAEERANLVERGIPTFDSFERGALSLRKVIDYHRFQAGMD